jgi:hypothetical protein
MVVGDTHSHEYCGRDRSRILEVIGLSGAWLRGDRRLGRPVVGPRPMQLTPTAGAAGVRSGMVKDLATGGRSTDNGSRSQVQTAVHAIDMAFMPPGSCSRL